MIKRVVFATIVSANYLAYAKTLSDSLLRNGHDELQVLLVDRKSDSLNDVLTQTGLNYRFAEDLGIPDFERVAYKYDIVEFNTALKPTFLKTLFKEGAEHVIYLDPDIQVFKPLSPVLDALDTAEIVLTPHALQPVMDELRPSDVDYLRTGTFNLGFIALGKGNDSQALLNWWESRCLGMGFNDPAFGTFVDQKWIDLAPCYFESVAILKHPGCNVAYWNLHERNLHEINEEIYVNDQPLIFFHFSGVKADKPAELSRHQTRHKIKNGSILQKMTYDYCGKLNLFGHEKYKKFKYSFGEIDNGEAITLAMRRALLAWEEAEPKPFNSNSKFQLALKKNNVKSLTRGDATPSNVMNFNENDWRVTLVNKFIRILGKALGVERTFLLIKYCAVLSRESNFSRVILNKPFDFTHKLRR